MLDVDGKRLATKTMSVNQPLRFGGVTAYQTDWSITGLTLRATGPGTEGLDGGSGAAFTLPVAALKDGERRGGGGAVGQASSSSPLLTHPTCPLNL